MVSFLLLVLLLHLLLILLLNLLLLLLLLLLPLLLLLLLHLLLLLLLLSLLGRLQKKLCCCNWAASNAVQLPVKTPCCCKWPASKAGLLAVARPGFNGCVLLAASGQLPKQRCLQKRPCTLLAVKTLCCCTSPAASKASLLAVARV